MSPATVPTTRPPISPAIVIRTVSWAPLNKAGSASTTTDHSKSMIVSHDSCARIQVLPKGIGRRPQPAAGAGAPAPPARSAPRSALRFGAEPLLVDGIVAAIGLDRLQRRVDLLHQIAALRESDPVFVGHHLGPDGLHLAA